MIANEINLKGGMVDCLKFLLSILVVIIHVGKPDFLSPVLRCAVPLFFMISSYFFFSKYDNLENDKEKNRCLYNYINRIFKLYLFWFIVLLPFTIEHRNWYEVSFLNIVKSFLFSSTFPASWYIMASIIGMLLIVYLEKFLSSKICFIICFILYLFCCLTSNYGNIVQPLLGDLYNSYINIFTSPYNSFPVSLIWIWLGMHLSRNRTKTLLNQRYLYSVFFVSVFFLYVEYFIIRKFNIAYTDDCYFMLLPVCYIFLLILGRMQFLISPKLYLRKTSTIIYCIHIPIMHLLYYCLHIYNINLSYWIVLLIVFCGCIVSFVITRLEPIFKFLKYSY